MMAIGVIAVVMMVSGLRVTWRIVRPARTAVSPKACVAMVRSLLRRWCGRGGLLAPAGAADDREEDVFERGLLLHVLDRGGRQQRLEFGQGAVDDDAALVQDRDPVG